VIGSSFGGAVAVYAGGTNPRIAAVISNGGWGHGERKFRGQHPTPEAWAKFTAMLEEGRAYRARTGKSLMVPRDDIVPIPDHVRDNLDKQNVDHAGAQLGRDVSGRDRAEHVRFPRRGGGRQDRAAAALAHPCRQRFGDADRAVDRDVQARGPAERSCICSAVSTIFCSREFHAGLERDAQLARRYFPGGKHEPVAGAVDHGPSKILERMKRVTVGHEELGRFIRDALVANGASAADAVDRRRRIGLGQFARRRRPRRLAAAASISR
jgi:hypothetical protein